MSDLNKVILSGRLTNDPILRYTPNKAPVCDFGLAMNRVYTKNENEQVRETTFVDVTVWDKQAENCSKFLKKGSHVFLEGRLREDNWEKNGEKRSKMKVTALSVQFLSSPKSLESESGNGEKEVVVEKVESVEEFTPF